MNYKITKLERVTTSTGKAKINASLIAEDGNTTDNVSIWSDFQDFANLKEDSMVVGDLVPSKDPKWGPTLYSPKTEAPRRSAGAITKAMERKEESIEKFQGNKEEGIKISATMRDAVLCAIAEYNKDTTNLDTLEELIRKWRKILWFEYDNHNQYPPFLGK